MVGKRQILPRNTTAKKLKSKKYNNHHRRFYQAGMACACVDASSRVDTKQSKQKQQQPQPQPPPPPHRSRVDEVSPFDYNEPVEPQMDTGMIRSENDVKHMHAVDQSHRGDGGNGGVVDGDDDDDVDDGRCDDGANGGVFDYRNMRYTTDDIITDYTQTIIQTIRQSLT
jgi:hypothetical protein